MSLFTRWVSPFQAPIFVSCHRFVCLKGGFWKSVQTIIEIALFHSLQFLQILHSNRHTRIVPTGNGLSERSYTGTWRGSYESRSVNGIVWMITHYFKPGTGIRRRTLACSWNSYSQASMRFTGDTLNGTTVFLSKSEKWLRPTSDLLLSFEREGQQQLHLSWKLHL